MSKGPRVLIYDIETSLQPVAVFRLSNNDWIDPKNLLAERHLVSVCWKWLGESRVHSVSLLDDSKRFARDPHDDRHVCNVFHKVLEEADYVVHHNGDNFDLPYLKTRMMVNGLSVLPPIATVDTYKVAKGNFMFNSNKLDYLGKLLGFGRKKHTDIDLWLDVLNGDKKAIRYMVEYNKQDVLLLEKVFNKLAPYMPNHINRELFGGTGCPQCGSTKYQSRGTHKAISRVYTRYQCQNPKCMRWFRSVVNDKKVQPRFRVL